MSRVLSHFCRFVKGERCLSSNRSEWDTTTHMNDEDSLERPIRMIEWEDWQSIRAELGSVQGPVATVAGSAEVALGLLPLCSSLTIFCATESERYVLELKWKAISTLHPDNVYNLFGIHPGGRRVFVYHQLRAGLSLEARQWWDAREQWIREGLKDSGVQEQKHRRLEQWFKRFRMDGTHQNLEYLPNRKRWKLLEPMFKKAVSNSITPDFWRSDNPYAHMILNSEWDLGLIQSALPALSYSGMEAIRNARTKMLWTGSIENWLETPMEERFAIVYLGSGSEFRLDHNMAELLRSRLLEEGKAFCWSIQKPAITTLTWRKSIEPVRSAHSGSLWIGTIF